jgi:hypothetical protein
MAMNEAAREPVGGGIHQARDERIVREFKARCTRPLVTMLLLILCALIYVVQGNLGYEQSGWLVVAGLGLGFLSFLFALVSWRCPSCDRYLGQAFHDPVCPRCGIPLR